MRVTILLITFLTTLCCLSAIGQTTMPPRVAFIDSNKLLDPDTGLKRFNSAAKLVDNEFKTKLAELQALQARAAALTTEANAAGGAGNNTLFLSKKAELDKLNQELQQQTDKAKAAYDARFKDLTGPIYQEVSRAIGAYAKSKGFDIVLDLNDTAGFIYLNPAADVKTTDITTAFLTFYNLSPAGMAAVIEPCPVVRLSPSPAEVKRGAELTVEAVMTGGDVELNPTFSWTLTRGGTIIQGQGTNKLVVDTTTAKDSSVDVSLDLGGLPTNCKRTSQASVPVKP